MKANLNRDQISRMILGVLMLIVGLVAFQSLLLSPLALRTKSQQAQIEESEVKLREANGTITRVTNLKKALEASKARLDKLLENHPRSAPIAWFPPMIQSFFSRQELQRAAVTLINRDVERMGGYQLLEWSVDFSQADFFRLGAALATLENTDRLLEIQEITISVRPDDPEFQAVSLRLASILIHSP